MHRLLNYCLLVFVFRALIESMNFADKPIDEALRNLQEVFQITVSTYICIILYTIVTVNGSVTCYLIFLQGEAQLIERIVSVSFGGIVVI